MTKNPEIRFAKSIVDYIFRWLATKFLSPEAQFQAGVNDRESLDEANGGADGEPAGPAGRASASQAAARRGRAGSLRGHPEPGRRAALFHLRRDHGAQRQLLQVRQLREHQRLFVIGRGAPCPRSGSLPRQPRSGFHWSWGPCPHELGRCVGPREPHFAPCARDS